MSLPFLVSSIRERGPLTVAEFMDAALYHPVHGYYSRAPQRTGRDGDFFTSVDVGPLFGELIAEQLDEMWQVLRGRGAAQFDLVEAGAGNGRLARDILDAAEARHRELYDHVRLTLVERSAAARGAQRHSLGRHAERLVASREDLPHAVVGAIVANELLDALPVHVVLMTSTGLREVFIAERNGVLVETAGPISTPAIADYLADCEVTLEPGARMEVGLRAVQWVREAAAALDRGFLLIVDYGCEARELSSPIHAAGTLMAYRSHQAQATGWLESPGESDLTAHVNLTAVRQAAGAAGLSFPGAVDQTYFLTSLGLADRVDAGTDRGAIGRRLSARTLIMPGGLGSTMKVMVFARNAGDPALRGFATGRVT